MPTLKRGDLEKRVMELGFSRRKARQAVQNTFDVMAKWLTADRRLPLELGLGDSKQLCGELKVTPQLHKSRTIFTRHTANRLFRRHWQIVWEDPQNKRRVRARRSAPRSPRPRSLKEVRPQEARPQEARPQAPAPFRYIAPSSVPWMPTRGYRTRFR